MGCQNFKQLLNYFTKKISQPTVFELSQRNSVCMFGFSHTNKATYCFFDKFDFLGILFCMF